MDKVHGQLLFLKRIEESKDKDESHSVCLSDNETEVYNLHISIDLVEDDEYMCTLLRLKRKIMSAWTRIKMTHHIPCCAQHRFV